MFLRLLAATGAVASLAGPTLAAERLGRSDLDALIARHAEAYGIPASLVHRVVKRESKYNPNAHHRGNWGLMQIRHETARAMGYSGPASGLLDAETNLTYGVRYLANAYRVAGANQDRAVTLYTQGYYHEAKRRGLLADMATARPDAPRPPADTHPAATTQTSPVPAWPWLQPTSAADWRLPNR